MPNTLLNIIDLNRPFALIAKNGKVSCFQGKFHLLQQINDIQSLANSSCNDIVFALPFRTIAERGFATKGCEPILALEATTTLIVDRDDLLAILPGAFINLRTSITPSMTDAEFTKLVGLLQENEIDKGNASQVTLSRYFSGNIENFDIITLLSIYRKVLQQQGSYMAILYANIDPNDKNKSQFIIGATPERHLEITGNKVMMTPIAGTLRKQDVASFPQRLADFVSDHKEINELYQVVDEVMKIMGVICPKGGKIEGPYLFESGAVVHTKYELIGQRSKSTIDALRHTLHSPTVIGSPIASAARIIDKYEQESRRYYAGTIGVYRYSRDDITNGDIDSAILIRCCEVFGDGSFRVQAGSGIVQSSVPENEAKESRAKAMGFLGLLTNTSQKSPIYLTKELQSQFAEKLNSRNDYLSAFWVANQYPYQTNFYSLENIKITIINNEDNFAYMIGHILQSHKAEVKIFDTFVYDGGHDDSDIIILGPGPGDPNDMTNLRMKLLQEIISSLKKPVLGICLGHQVLAIGKNITVLQQDKTSQGIQRMIVINDMNIRQGFYNSFSPIFDEAAGQMTDISFDLDENKRIIVMKGKRFIGVQFHPESVMSCDGPEFICQAILNLQGEI